MSATETKFVEVEEKLKDITECSICSDTFKEPKILSCVHTFCRICLEEYGTRLGKNPGNQMTCPICRKEFSIPEGGFTHLAKNFFMEKLIEMKDSLKPTFSKLNVCESCLEDHGSDTETELPSAQMFCVECNQKLCIECHKRHAKKKATKSHRTISLECQQEVSLSALDTKMSESCDKHPVRSLEIYCSNCKDVACTMCFLECHKSHEGMSIDSVTESFQEEIRGNIETLSTRVSNVEHVKEKLLTNKTKFITSVVDIENEINKTRDELIELVHRHSECLLAELQKKRGTSSKQCECDLDDIETLLVSLNSFKTYCTQMMSIGSSSNICRAAQTLSRRAEELKQLCTNCEEKSFEFPQLCLKKCDFEYILKQQGGSIVGNIRDEREPNEEVENQATSCNELNDRLREEVSQVTVEDESLKEVGGTKPVLVDEQTWTRREEELKNRIEDLKKQVALLQSIINGGNTTIKSEGNANFAAGLEFSKEIVPVAFKTSNSWRIKGLAILDDELFIASSSQVIEINNLKSLIFKRRWKLERLGNILDMTHSPGNKSLLLLNEIASGRKKEILRVDPNGNVLASWIVEATGQLSAAVESTVLFTNSEKSQLEIYTPDGAMIHCIPLTWNSGFEHLWHAVQLTSNHFVVSHGSGSDPLHRICIVDMDGNVVHNFGREFNQKLLNCPIYLAIDKDDNILVADNSNSRLLFSSGNEFKMSEIYHNRSRLVAPVYCAKPTKIAIDERNGRVYLAENQWKASKYGDIETADFLSVLTIPPKAID